MTCIEEERRSLHFSSEQHASSFLARIESEDRQNDTPEMAKKRQMKEMVDSIPTNQEKLFNFPVDWESCEKYDVVRQTMRSWVMKKFVEYLGEDVPSLTSFILTKLSKRCHPEELLSKYNEYEDRQGRYEHMRHDNSCP